MGLSVLDTKANGAADIIIIEIFKSSFNVAIWQCVPIPIIYISPYTVVASKFDLKKILLKAKHVYSVFCHHFQIKMSYAWITISYMHFAYLKNIVSFKVSAWYLLIHVIYNVCFTFYPVLLVINGRVYNGRGRSITYTVPTC